MEFIQSGQIFKGQYVGGEPRLAQRLGQLVDELGAVVIGVRGRGRKVLGRCLSIHSSYSVFNV